MPAVQPVVKPLICKAQTVCVLLRGKGKAGSTELADMLGAGALTPVRHQR